MSRKQLLVSGGALIAAMPVIRNQDQAFLANGTVVC